MTVREVELRYKMDGKVLSTISDVILTGTIRSGRDKKDVDAAIVRTGGRNIILGDWNNLRTEIGRHDRIEPGGVLSGSAYFVMDFRDRAKLEQLKEVELVVIDFSGRESKRKVKIENDWLERATDAVILNRQFTYKNGSVTLA